MRLVPLPSAVEAQTSDDVPAHEPPGRIWLSLGTIMLGMIPLAVIFAAARVHPALGVAALVFFLCAGSRTYVVVEKKRKDIAASHADIVRVFLGSTGRLLGAILVLIAAFPSTVGLGGFLFVFVGLVAEKSGGQRVLYFVGALLACALWVVLMLATVHIIGLMFSDGSSNDSHTKAQPVPSAGEPAFKPRVTEVNEESNERPARVV